jgi:hypothetical protein
MCVHAKMLALEDSMVIARQEWTAPAWRQQRWRVTTGSVTEID